MGVVAAMLCVMASAASAAGGVNLSWTNCFGEGTGANNKTSACAVNTGTNLLVTSFVIDHDIAAVSGNELVVDFLSQSATMPAWWDMKDAGTCRQLALGFNLTANAGDAVCVDWAQGQSAGGIGAYNNTGIENTTINPSLSTQWRRLKIAVAVPLAGLQDLVANTEYFSCNITVNNTKTTGAGSCAGCTEPICIVFNSLKVTTNSGAGDFTIGAPTSPGTNIVTWQGVGPNCQAVPTKNATWGAVKALYR
jgi:hypothetical protein